MTDPTGHTVTVDADFERGGPYASRIVVGGRSHRLVTAAHGAVQLVEVDGVTHRVSRDEGGVDAFSRTGSGRRHPGRRRRRGGQAPRCSSSSR